MFAPYPVYIGILPFLIYSPSKSIPEELHLYLLGLTENSSEEGKGSKDEGGIYT